MKSKRKREELLLEKNGWEKIGARGSWQTKLDIDSARYKRLGCLPYILMDLGTLQQPSNTTSKQSQSIPFCPNLSSLALLASEQ